jgi:ATP-binding cassette, subfamily B, multidrug efflux pump
MKILLRLLPYFKGHGWVLGVGFFWLLVQNIGYTLMPASMKGILDEIQGENNFEVILSHGVWVLVLMVVAGYGMYAMRKKIITLSRDVEYDLRKDLFKKMGALDFSFYARHKTGDLISRCTNDLEHVRTLLGPGIMYIPNSICRLVLFAPVLVALDGTMTAMVMGQMFFLVTMIMILMPRLKPLHSRLQAQVGAINDRVWETLTGINTIQLYTREEVEKKRFESLNEEYIRRHMHVERYNAFLWPFFISIFTLSEVILLGWGGRQVILEEMTLGELLQFKVMVAVLAFPVLSLGWVMSIMQQGISAMERVALIMDEPLAMAPEGKEWLEIPNQSEGLSFCLKGLRYSYPDQEREVLSSIDLETRPGEVVGITGPVGSGKTTLMHLLQGVLKPEPGQLYINGIDVIEIRPKELYDAMAVVPQDAFLFSRPLEDNIALSELPGEGALSENQKGRVEASSKEAQLHGDVLNFPKVYEEWVGERGVTLSGGQKQRATLARALFKGRSLLMIDDGLSAVDAETEEKILDVIRERSRNQAVVIVSHRISAIRHADRILVLEGGRVSEEGSHEVLMSGNGLYRQLADLQQMDSELEAESI